MATCADGSLLDRLYRDQTAAKFKSELLWVFAKTIDDADRAGLEMDPSVVESLLDKGDFVVNEENLHMFFAATESLDQTHGLLFAHLASNNFLVEVLPPMPFDCDSGFAVRISQVPLSKRMGPLD